MLESSFHLISEFCCYGDFSCGSEWWVVSNEAEWSASAGAAASKLLDFRCKTSAFLSEFARSCTTLVHSQVVSSDSPVSIMPGTRRSRNCGLIPGRGSKEICLLQSVHAFSGTSPASHAMGVGSSSPGGKSLKAWPSPLTIIHCRSEECMELSSPPYAFMLNNDHVMKAYKGVAVKIMVVLEQAVKAQRKSRGILLLFL